VTSYATKGVLATNSFATNGYLLMAMGVASFGLILFGPIWTTIRFDEVSEQFLWMQRAFDEPFYLGKLYWQIIDGTLDINYRFFSKLLGALVLSMGASFDEMATVYAIINPILVFTGALILAATWEKRSVARLIWALLLVLSFDLLSGSNLIVYPEPPAAWLSNLIGDPALLRPDSINNFFLIHRRPEPQSSWIVLFPYLAALISSFLNWRRGLYIGVCVATPFLALIYINVGVVAILIFVQLSILSMLVYRRPIAVPFGLSFLVTVLLFGLIFISESTSTIVARSTIYTHSPVLRPSLAMALLGLLWGAMQIRRHGVNPSRLAALVCFGVPLIALNQQIATGIAMMPQIWEFYTNYICLVVGAGLMSTNFLSSLEEKNDWKQFVPLGLWALLGFVVIRGELRNEAQTTGDNARSVIFAKVLAEAKAKVGHIDAVILPYVHDDSLFVTRAPRGTVVLGGYTWFLLHPPPLWRSDESFAEHAKKADISFDMGFETLFRSGVTAEQFKKSLEYGVEAGSWWPTLIYFFSLNDCWPAFLNYTSPATKRLASAISPLVAMYKRYLDEQSATALTRRQVLLIRTQPVSENAPLLVDSELVATSEVDVRGTPVRAYGYIQRQKQ